MNSWLVYGVNPVIEALQSEIRFETILLAVGLNKNTREGIEQLARMRGVRIQRTDRRELDNLTGGGVHQGVVAIAGKPASCTLEELAAIEKKPRTLILCLDGVQDPRNLGALARSALALGAAGLIIPANRASGVTPAAIKSSAGALAIIPVVRVPNLAKALDELKQLGFWISGAVMTEGQAPWGFDPGEKVALVLGSEGSGVRSGVESRLDFRVVIPTDPSMESLNVSVAGAMLMYEWLCRPR